MYTLAEIVTWSQGKYTGDDLGTSVIGVSIDTRTIKRGEIFFAVKGEQSDGHEYIHKAFEKGAIACVVESSREKTTEGSLILVDDVVMSLQNCAREYRKQLQIPVIGITGSSGKTTTKNMIAAVLNTKYNVCATRESYNNHLGVPLSVLSVKNEDEIGVFEVGMNHVGEMAPLAEIIKPDVVVITGIGMAHVEAFENTTCIGGPQEAIAREKSELVKALSKNGLLVLPEKEKFKDLIASFSEHSRVVTISVENQNAALIQKKLIEKGFAYALATHMLQNALLAIAVGHEYKIDEHEAAAAIATAEYEERRFAEKNILIDGVLMHVVDDTYNANPDSVCAGIEMLSKMRVNNAKLIVTLGALKELGGALTAGYQRIYETIVKAGIDVLILCGIEWNPEPVQEVKPLHIIHVQNHAECAEKIKDVYKEGDIVLVKGSKSSKMQEVVKLLAS
ncbi:MAG: UDP-N-acetylmuramoyl-tripeptide--D-alanyl-D-alanine ligase [bacterium]